VTLAAEPSIFDRPVTEQADADLLIEIREVAAKCSTLLDRKIALMAEFTKVAAELRDARLLHDQLRGRALHEGLDPGVLDSFETRYVNDYSVKAIRNEFTESLGWRG
jgi:hypothetical protein